MADNFTLDELVSKLDIQQWFLDNGLTKGKKWSECPCPFCGDAKHFAVAVTGSKKGLWKCAKCNESGNAISFYAKIHGTNNGAAVKAIKEKLGIVDEKPQGTRKNKKKETVEKKPADLPEGTKTIYNRFIELLPLTDAHRQELKSKRGFTDNTINTLKFRSGGKHVPDVIEQLKKEFSVEDLLGSGLLVKAKRAVIVEEQLTQEIILIPYIDKEGIIYHIRPHKLGLAGFAAQVYCSFLLKGKDCRKIILTEGEFKAAALLQWGIPALAIPGISSFGRKNLDRLINILKKLEVESVVVIFDNEIKSDPTLPNFKDRLDKRYDTQFWSYMTALLLQNKGEFETYIGTLPDEWREKGKIDFDMALAKGHTSEEIRRVIDRAVSPDNYFDTQPEEVVRILRRKKGKFFSSDLPIRREFNKYIVERRNTKGEVSYEDYITNFVIDIKSSFFTPSGVVRNMQFLNEYGERSDVFTLEPSDMAGVDSFKKFCLSKGNYIFEGNANDLILIWKFEFLRDDSEMIYMPEQIGYIDKGLWLFGNMAIKAGQVFEPDKDGVIWINGKGYKPQSLQIGPKGEPVEDSIPALYTKDVDIQEIATKLLDAIGGYEAFIGIGWVIGTIFSKEIFNSYKCYPILFPHGRRESGKTTYMRWMQAFFGSETEGISVGNTTTTNFIARILSYYSSLGVWFDEYRNENKVIEKDGFFRSAYNRQVSGKGTATAFQTKGFVVNSTIAISGEELPRDNGLFTRLINIQISANKRKSGSASNSEAFEWLNRHQSEFSGFTRHLILNYETYLPKILSAISGLKKTLLRCDISDRAAENWAICAACFDVVVGRNEGFLEWVVEACQDIKANGEQDHMLNQFWDDVNYLYSAGVVNNKHIKVDGDKLVFWFMGLYQEWSLYFKKKTGREPFDKNSIMAYLQEEQYFDRADGNHRLDGQQRKTVVIDWQDANETIKELAESIKSKSAPPEPF